MLILFLVFIVSYIISFILLSYVFNISFHNIVLVEYCSVLFIVQSVTSFLVLFLDYSSSLLILVESISVILFIVLLDSFSDSGYLFIMIVFTTLIVSGLIGLEGGFDSSLACKFVVLGILFKYGFIGIVLLVSSDKSDNILLYLLNSKFVLFVYGMVLYSSLDSYKPYLLDSFEVSFMFLVILLGLYLGSYVLLSSSDLEGFVVISFCISNILLVLIILISIKSFFLVFIWDIVLNILFYLVIANSISFINLISSGYGNKMFMFMFLCQVIGAPPFPSFYLEISFISLFYVNFGMSNVGFLVVLLILFMQVCLVFPFSSLLTSVKYYNSKVLNNHESIFSFKIFYIMVYVLLWGVFLCIF